MTFQPGQSGNPNGRPAGSRNKTTLAVEALLEGQATQLTQAAIDKALDGDIAALKLCLDRIAPVRKGRPVPLDLPELTEARSLAEAGVVVGNALAAGELSSEEAAGVMATLDGVKKLYEFSELERRISNLEKAAEERNS
jgi:hypothetical protein